MKSSLYPAQDLRRRTLAWALKLKVNHACGARADNATQVGFVFVGRHGHAGQRSD